MKSFANDISNHFTPGQAACMGGKGWPIKDFAFMSDPAGDHQYPDHANARKVFARLKGDDTPRMPPGGPYWTPAMLQTYQDWMSDGFLP